MIETVNPKKIPCVENDRGLLYIDCSKAAGKFYQR